MSVFRTNMSLRRRSVRFAAVLMALAAVSAVHAQTPPYAEFQYSTLSGSGNTITATRLPVVATTGIKYVNVVLQFDVAADGTLTLTPGYPQILPSPAQIISNFLAGNYVGPGGTGYQTTVFGPGVTSGGATEWSLAGTTSCAVPATATWYVFGGAMTKNPLYQRLKNAGISAQTYAAYGAWGTTGDQACNAGANWRTGTLIALSQTGGGGLAILSFTDNGVDQSQPVDQITYTKNP
ncbi:MAG: hypothetical protein U0Q18_03130 [Bryobacteraceae bacterium]